MKFIVAIIRMFFPKRPIRAKWIDSRKLVVALRSKP
jgi:hypothetical protein